MEAGEKEIRQAFEETTTRNVNTILEHSNETRKISRETAEKVINLENTIRSQNEVIKELRMQLAAIQAKLYLNGTS